MMRRKRCRSLNPRGRKRKSCTKIVELCTETPAKLVKASGFAKCLKRRVLLIQPVQIDHKETPLSDCAHKESRAEVRTAGHLFYMLPLRWCNPYSTRIESVNSRKTSSKQYPSIISAPPVSHLALAVNICEWFLEG